MAERVLGAELTSQRCQMRSRPSRSSYSLLKVGGHLLSFGALDLGARQIVDRFFTFEERGVRK